MLARKLISGSSGDVYHEYEIILTSSGTWTVPYTQTYEIHVCGGGGRGGYAGSGDKYRNPSGANLYFPGGSGGGGGSGAYTMGRVRLTANAIIPYTIGSSSFGLASDAYYMAVSSGSNGGDGTSATINKYSMSSCKPGSAGSGGAGGTITMAGGLASKAGNQGGYGQAANKYNYGSDPGLYGGSGGASVFSYKGVSYGAGGTGARANNNSGYSPSSGGSGVIVIVAVEV